MTYADLAQKLRDKIADLSEKRAAQANIILTVREACETETRDPSEDEAEQVRAAVTARDDFDAQLQDARDSLAEFEREAEIEEQREKDSSKRGYDRQARAGEKSIYNPDNAREGVSFFSDMYRESMGSRSMRLDDYRQQIENKRQERAVATSGFAGLVPPQYLINLAASTARAGRPIANSVVGLPLPDEGVQFQIPKGTTGASVAVQATENSSVSSTDEVWANVQVNVATIAGQQQVSRQSLERGAPGIDAIIFSDLANAYAVALDNQVISGTGTSGQTLGILNTANIGLSTAFGAAATATTFYSKVAGGVNNVETNRFLAPDVIYMHPRRWNWLVSQVDSAGRPLVVPDAVALNPLGTLADVPDLHSIQPVGLLQGLPVIVDANIPTNLGGATQEDVAIVARRGDLLLWEDGDGSPTDLRFEQTLGNQLTVTLVAYGYAAFTAGRYPTAVSQVGGAAAETTGHGLIAPTF